MSSLSPSFRVSPPHPDLQAASQSQQDSSQAATCKLQANNELEEVSNLLSLAEINCDCCLGAGEEEVEQF